MATLSQDKGMKRTLLAAIAAKAGIVTALMACASVAAAQAGPDIELPETNLEAAIASADITPPIGTRLGGYADRNASDTRDPLRAQVIVFNDGDRKAALVAVDTMMMYQEDGDLIKEAIQKSAGISPAYILINAAHCHSAPTLQISKDYRADVAERIAAAAAHAVNGLRPVSIGYGVGTIDFDISRRKIGADGKNIRGILDPEAPADHRVKILRIDDDSESVAPLGVIMHAVCHPAVFRGQNEHTSADFVGLARDTVERNFGLRTTAMFLQGCCGDIRPYMPVEGEPGFRHGSEQDLAWCGLSLGSEATKVAARVRVRQFARDRETDFKIAAAQDVLEITPRDEETLKADETWTGRSDHRNKLDEEKNKIIYPIKALRIGKFLFVGLTGEPVVEYAFGIERDLAETGLTVFVLGYTTGNAGYVPVKHQIAEGGYETWNLYSEETEKEIRDGVKKLIARLIDGTGSRNM